MHASTFVVRVARALALLTPLLLSPAARAHHDAEPPRLADLAWMEGRWVMDQGTGSAEEIWMAPLDRSMVGSFRWAIPGRMHVIELLVIEETDEAIHFRFKHFDRDYRAWEETPNTYRLKSLEGTTATFENVAWDRRTPQLLIYSRTDDHLVFRGESPDGEGDPLVLEFVLRQ
jgi:hypothetical protein